MELRDQLLRDFQNKEYRHAYVGDYLNASIAAQIKALREGQSLTQAQLAERSGMKQSRISALENVNYESWSIKTLRKLAEAFDVALMVKFESFSRRLDDIETFNRDALVVPSFENDVALVHARRGDDLLVQLLNISQPSQASPVQPAAIGMAAFLGAPRAA